MKHTSAKACIVVALLAAQGGLFVAGAQAVSAGGRHVCAISGSVGRLFCWGDNSDGQLGSGTAQQASPLPFPVEFPIEERILQVSAGKAHTCAISASGRGYCWGSGKYGQLGDGLTKSSRLPVRVVTDDSLVLVSAGDDHTCAVTAKGGGLCWGRSDDGRLGVGAPLQACGASNCLRPTVVPLAKGLGRITAGPSSSCGIDVEGRLYCWGRAADGRLGLGAEKKDAFVPVLAATAEVFQAVTVADHHACALSRTGKVYCWGHNQWGEVGDGTKGIGNRRWAPTATKFEGQFVGLSARREFTCAVATTQRLYCWGMVAKADFGPGTLRNYYSEPVRVPVGGVASVSAGTDHVCVAPAGEVLKCWGANEFGQLGMGTITTVPVASTEAQSMGGVFGSLPVVAQTLPAPTSVRAPGRGGISLTNQQVIEMVVAGLSEDIVATAVAQASESAFDVTPAGLMALKRAGVSDKVIQAMQRTPVSASFAVSPTPPVSTGSQSGAASPTGADADRLSRAHLLARVSSESGGTLALQSFERTNGFTSGAGGRELYTVEWRARVLVNRDVWKGGNALVGYWDSFSVGTQEPGTWQSLAMGGDPKKLTRGTIIEFDGSATLLRTERGWRVEGSKVTSARPVER